MKHRWIFALCLVLAIALVALWAPEASGQTLDDKWYKINCQCTTRAINSEGNSVAYNFSFNFYIHLGYVRPGPSPRGSVYDFEVWSQVAPDNWVITLTGTDRGTLGISENFFPDWGMPIAAKNGAYIYVYTSPFVSAEPGIWRSGGEIYGGADPQHRTLIGWVIMNGSLVVEPPFAVRD